MTARAPRVVDGAPARTDAARVAFEEAVEHTALDPRLWTGAFATNVWGGRYAVESVLGRGGQGTTFAGTDLKTGAKVALKVFDLGKAKEWKAHDLFDREVKTLKDISHPLMPQFMDVIVDDDTGARVLVMTHVPGESLHTIVKRDGPLSEAALWSTVVDVADVLGALHGHSSTIVHRDIKPHNLIRRPDGKVCLVDFGGVGRARKDAGSTVVGTFGYMAPEQLYGAQTPATDVYALGATLLSLATGTEPEDLPRDGLRIDVDKSAPHLSAPLRALLTKLLSPEPKERPQDARALLTELRAVATQEPAGYVDVPDEGHRVEIHGDGDFWVGMIGVVFGLLGVAGAVIVGRLILPLLLTILAAASGPEQRARLHGVRARVQDAAKLAQQSFQHSAQHGAKKLEQASERERRRAQKHRDRHAARAHKQAEKQRRRHQKFWV